MKQSFHKIMFFTLLVSAFFFNSSQVPAQSETITDLGPLGGVGSIAYGINNQGQIVGENLTLPSTIHAVVWQNGAMTDLGTLGGNFSNASGINDRGQIVGSSLLATGETHTTLWMK